MKKLMIVQNISVYVRVAVRGTPKNMAGNLAVSDIIARRVAAVFNPKRS